MTKYFLILFCFQINLSVIGQNNDLLLVYDGGKYGYINTNGEYEISPSYLNAYGFSQGLAAVRIEGTYGYINTKNKLVLKNIYDFAEAFKNGKARVYKNGIPYLIDKTGKTIFEHDFLDFGEFNQGIAVAKKRNKTYVLIDSLGKEITTPYTEKNIDFKFGLAVLEGKNHERFGKIEESNTLVIDQYGKTVIQSGIYNEIQIIDSLHIKGYKYIKKKSNTPILMNRNGEIILESDKNLIVYDPSELSGYYDAEIIEKKKGKKVRTSVIIDSLKNIKYRLPEDSYISKYNNELIILHEKDSLYILNDQFIKTDKLNFEYVDQSNFSFIITTAYSNGIKMGVMDLKGNEIIKCRYNSIIPVSKDRFMVRFDYEMKEALKTITNIDSISPFDKIFEKYMLIDQNEQLVSQKLFNEFDSRGFNNNVLAITEDSTYSLIDYNGRIIWQQKPTNLETNNSVNIDYMNWGSFRATSSVDVKERGHYKSKNEAKSTNDSLNFKSNSFEVFIDTSDNSSQVTYPVYVYNTTKDTIWFSAQDSRLYMTTQAFNESGNNYKDIEYLLSSWCGNSYHDVYLSPNEFWTFTTNRYTGIINTQLRIELISKPSTDSEIRNTHYSNIYNGSINPGQFWRVPGYTPKNLMDPYKN